MALGTEIWVYIGVELQLFIGAWEPTAQLGLGVLADPQHLKGS